jgi:PIN domain nuclease of toxin-antitoxin system
VILLDTHVLVSWAVDSKRLSARAIQAIVGAPPVLVSPISFWELAVLTDRGRLEVDRDLNRWHRDFLVSTRSRVAELTPSIAIHAARQPGFRGDTADRFIYATALELGAPLVSRDAKIREYAGIHGDVEVIW